MPKTSASDPARPAVAARINVPAVVAERVERRRCAGAQTCLGLRHIPLGVITRRRPAKQAGHQDLPGHQDIQDMGSNIFTFDISAAIPEPCPTTPRNTNYLWA